MYQRILMPTDGSACSEHALGHGLAIAKSLDAEVTFLSVVEDPRTIWHTIEHMPYDDALYQDLKRASSEALAQAMKMAQDAGVRVAPVLLLEKERPVDAIARLASEYDLIVMGTHGRRGFDHFVMGSVTEGVVRRSQTPVLVVRCPRS